MSKTDIHLAKTAFYESMNYFENSIASIVAVNLIEGLEKGYNQEKSKDFSFGIIEEEINKFLKMRNRVIIDD